ncbi:MBL fold metallo-hydrolase [Vibrio sp. WXL103]|uniref:MBL fold metallo-hydrolase n=1 Tax=Vibrio sp. WXL103 TaxID=3450710 RepID=UPI003EC8B457
MKLTLPRITLVGLAAMSLLACGRQEIEFEHQHSFIQHGKPGAEYRDGKFHNTELVWDMSIGKMREAMTSARHEASTPDHSLPSRAIPEGELEAQGVDRLYRLGHSTVLMELGQDWVITDPVFVDRASPLQWIGPKRFDPSAVTIDQLPQLKAVVISHNHYDHLDKHSIRKLVDKSEHFIVPLKLGALLERWGVPREKIIELDWWQGVELAGLTISATPAQHYSNRGLLDRDESLWASYVLETEKTRVFFSGDSGYFSGFAEIGEHFGGFDLALLEVGAYNELWRDIHLLPEDAMQAHLDLQAQVLVPIHNGTFDLGRHAWWEPFEAMEALGAEHDTQVLLPMFGEPVSIKHPEQSVAWWKDYLPADHQPYIASY